MQGVKRTDIPKIAVTLSAVLLTLLTLYYLFNNGKGGKMGSAPQTNFRYEAVTGFFMQDDLNTDAATFDYTKTNFGLINRPYPSDATLPSVDQLTQWQRFFRHINHLQSTSGSSIHYKLIYMGRHGEGTHNVAEAFYGTKAWDDYWSHLDGNGTVSWSDAHLTPTGEEQAREARAFLGEHFAWAKMPVPERWIVSPLYRCLQTANITWTGLDLPAEDGEARGTFKPVIMEGMREVMGVHTCDRRSSRTFIHEAFPEWEIEAGFSEEDELWRADHRETWDEHDARMRGFLDEMFLSDVKATVVSFTAHSGTIASLLRVMGHREFRLPTGAMIPVLVKATSST